MQFEGAVLWKGDEGYEPARQAAVWNVPQARSLSRGDRPGADPSRTSSTPSRWPGERGLRVKARAGGHAWSGSSVRSGMLIDLSRLNEVAFDADTGIASVQPGVKGRDLNVLLAEHGLFFPSGPLPVRRHRRLPAAGRLGLELARDRAGLHEHRRGRRGHRLPAN